FPSNRCARPHKPRTAAKESPGIAGAQFSFLSLADAHVYGSPGKYAWCDRDPHPSGASIPTGQEHPLAVPETAGAEMPPVYEKVAVVNPMSELVDVGLPDVYPMIAVLITAVHAVLVIAIAVVQVIAVLITAVHAVFVIPITVVHVIAVLLIVERTA